MGLRIINLAEVLELVNNNNLIISIDNNIINTYFTFNPARTWTLQYHNNAKFINNALTNLRLLIKFMFIGLPFHFVSCFKKSQCNWLRKLLVNVKCKNISSYLLSGDFSMLVLVYRAWIILIKRVLLSRSMLIIFQLTTVYWLVTICIWSRSRLENKRAFTL